MAKKTSMAVLKAKAKGYGISGVSKFKEADREELERLLAEAEAKLNGEKPTPPKEEAPKEAEPKKADTKEKPKAPTKKETPKKTKKEKKGINSPASTELVVHGYSEVAEGTITLDQLAETCKRTDITNDQRREIITTMNSGVGAKAILTGMLLISTELKGGELHELAFDKFNIKKTQCNVYVRIAKKLGDRIEELKDHGVNELIELCKPAKEEGEGDDKAVKVKSNTIITALKKIKTQTEKDIEVSGEDTAEGFLEQVEEIMEEIQKNILRSLGDEEEQEEE